MWWVLTALLFILGVWGIPEDIASPFAFLSSFGDEWLIRTLATVLAFVLALVWIGPIRVQEWYRWASDWWHSSARLQAENEQLKSEKTELKERLAAYEGRNAPKLVVKAENPGPVVLEPQQPGHHFGFNSRHEKGVQHYRDILIVPYKFNDGADTSAAEPAAAFEVEDVDDILIVAFSYEVRSPKELQFQQGGQHQVWLEVTDVDKALVRRVNVSPEHGPAVAAAKDEDFGELMVSAFSGSAPEISVTWRNIVSSSCHLYDLPRGTYGLSLKEELARDYGPREYRNMRLTVRKLAS